MFQVTIGNNIWWPLIKSLKMQSLSVRLVYRAANVEKEITRDPAVR